MQTRNGHLFSKRKTETKYKLWENLLKIYFTYLLMVKLLYIFILVSQIFLLLDNRIEHKSFY